MVNPRSRLLCRSSISKFDLDSDALPIAFHVTYHSIIQRFFRASSLLELFAHALRLSDDAGKTPNPETPMPNEPLNSSNVQKPARLIRRSPDEKLVSCALSQRLSTPSSEEPFTSSWPHHVYTALSDQLFGSVVEHWIFGRISSRTR